MVYSGMGRPGTPNERVEGVEDVEDVELLRTWEEAYL
jgi:hypothetical protein